MVVFGICLGCGYFLSRHMIQFILWLDSIAQVSRVPFASFGEMGRTIVAVASNGAMSLDEFHVLCYGAGRAMLWIVVIFALWSMYDYFTKFYGKVRDRIEVRERRRSRILRRRRRKAAAAVLGSGRGEGVKG